MLFQQQSKIEVIVRKEDDSGEEKGNETLEAGESTNNPDGKKNTKANNKQTKIRATQIYSAFKQIRNLAVNYGLGGLGYYYGDASYQDLWQRNIEILNDFGSIISAVGIGATYGSIGGPVGMAIGIATNVATTTASLLTKYANREREFSVKEFKQNNQIQYARARAGVNFTNGRLR